MSWRTVVVSTRCKLDLKMGFMVVRGEEIKRIFLDEIAVLILENPAVSLTGMLLEALVARKVKVVFCDSRHLPMAELAAYSSHFSSPSRLRGQIAWTDGRKGAVWTEIIAEKLRRQAGYLNELGFQREAELVLGYAGQLELFDPTHREAHAAKVYFNAIFGMSFSRSEESALNSALNYGYSLLLAALSREIAAAGYSTQLGLCHSGACNRFNLASDLMEPFRIIVDRAVRDLAPESFGKEEKHKLAAVLETPVLIAGGRQTLLNALRIYARSVFDSLESSGPVAIQSWLPL